MHLAPSLAVVAALAAAGPSSAAWLAGGNAVGIGSGDQILPRAVPDGAGGAYVCWLGANGGGGYDAYAQRLTSSGDVAGGWPGGGLPLGLSNGVDLAPDGGGGLYVTWSDNSTVYLLRLTSAGAPSPGWPAGGVDAAGATGGTTTPIVIQDGAGGALLAWSYFTGTWSVRAQRVSAAGANQWGATGAPLSAAANPGAPWIVGDGSGGLLAVLQTSPDALQWDVTVQHLTGTGAVSAGWPADGMVVAGASGGNHVLGAQGTLGIAGCAVSDGAGGVIVAWEETLAHDILALRVQGDGTIASGWTPGGTPVALASQTGYWGLHPVAVTDGAGGVLVIWDEFRPGGTDVRAMRLSGAAAPAWAGPVDLLVATFNQEYPVAASNGAGGAIVVPWEDQRNGADDDLYAQLVDADGNTGHPVAGLPVSAFPGDQSAFSIAATSAWTGIVVFEDGRNGRDKDVYAAAFAGAGNVDATMTPAGWASPAVPRDVTGSTAGFAPLPATLPGNAAGTWLNWSFRNESYGGLPEYAVTPPSMPVTVRLDDVQAGTTATMTSPWTTDQAVDVGPITVRGGRHTLETLADPGGTVPEWDETDNAWSGQWVWSPLATAFEVPLVRALPPVRGTLPLPNSDGFEFSRNPSYAWLASLAPFAPGDDYDLRVYDDYSGSSGGFSNEVAASLQGGNVTDYVVGHYSLTPVTVYPAAIRFATSGGGSDFFQDQTDARFRQGGDAAAFEHIALPKRRLADVYEAFLQGSMSYRFALRRETGPSDLLFRLHPGTPGTAGGRADAIASSTALDADTDVLDFTPPATAWYPIVVLRDVGTEADQDMEYSFFWGDARAVDAPATAAAPGRLAFDGARPNPAPGATRFRFELPAPAATRLALYDVTGRRVRLLVDHPVVAGATELVWDGRDDRGGRVAAGTYFARFEALGRTVTRPVTVLR
jgi:hypothetical protein